MGESSSFFGKVIGSFPEGLTSPNRMSAITCPPSHPGYQGPSAQDVAWNVVNSLPADATPQQVADAVVNAMPEYPEQQEITIPEYTTMDIILAILVAIAIVIGLVLLFRKK